jgi:C4-dicarboxylate-binding protein DctP
MTRSVAWFCLFLTFLSLASSTAPAQPIKLRATVQVAATNPLLGIGLLQLKEEVEKRTDKAVPIEIFDKGQLYIDDQVVGAVSSGAIEIGVAGFNQFVKHIPAVDIMQQPFLFNFEALVRATTSPDSQLRKLVDQAVLDTLGVRVLWWQSFGSTVFFSKGMDVAEPHRLKDKKVRVFSQTMAELTKHCGGKPLVLSSSKMHEALKDGTVDMAMTGIGTVETRELWKVTDTVTRTEHGALEFFVIINEKTWQALAPHHQAIIIEASRNAEQRLRDNVSKVEMNAYAFARQKGMKIRELTPDQVAEWRACSWDVLDAYMNNPGDLPRQLLEAYGKLRTQPCCTAGPRAGVLSRR